MRLPTFGCLLALIVVSCPAASQAASACPSIVAFDPAANQSSADTGWTGIAHDRPIYGNVLRLGLDCGPDIQPCGTCPVTGLLPEAEGMYQRCANDTSIVCTEATEVADCGAVDTCAVFLTVPQAVAVGGVAACYTHALTSPPTGSVHVENGALSVDLAYQSVLYLGNGSIEACPKCVDDPVANDGTRGGTCTSGTRTGLTCDGHGPPAPLYEELGTSSFDCPQVPGFIISTREHGPLTFSTGTQSRTLGPTSPNCGSAAPGKKCFCQTCNNPAEEACDEDSDCPDPPGPFGPQCGGNRCVSGPNDGTPCSTASECPTGECKRAGEPSRPNACLDDTTTPDDCTDTAPLGDGKGRCAIGPVDQYCSNHPNRGCIGDADCDGGPGACAMQSRPCFTTSGTSGDVLSVSGVATPPDAGISEPTELGMLACLEAAESVAVNNVIGLPGLTRNLHVGRLVFSESVSPFPACPPAPDACRAPSVTGKSPLRIKDRTPDTKDTLRWQWNKGTATTLAELGDPTTTEHYDLCLYDGGGLRAAMTVPAGRLCDGRPCWKPTSTGFLYKTKTGAPRGITKLQLKSGATGKASIRIDGKGDLLPLPTLSSLVSPLTVQLRHRPSGLCWGTSYVAPFKRFNATELQAVD